MKQKENFFCNAEVCTDFLKSMFLDNKQSRFFNDIFRQYAKQNVIRKLIQQIKC